MNLNMNLVADALRDDFVVVKEDINDEGMHLEQVRLFTGGSNFLPGIVYVAKGERLPKKPFFEGFCAIISIGPSDKCYLPSECGYIELEEDTSVSHVLNRIQEAYKKYDKWLLDMYEALSNESGIQRLLDLTLPLLGNPIYLHDHNYHFVAHAEIPGMPGGSDIYQVKKNGGRLSRKAIDELKSTPYFEKTFETTKPTYHIDAGECSYIYDNVRTKGEYWGRLFIDERVRSFKRGDYAIIERLSAMIEKALFSRNLFPNRHYRPLEQKLVAILDGESMDINELNEELRLHHWGSGSQYFCFYLQTQEVDLLLNTMINTCEHIESKLPDCIAFPYESGIIGLAHVDCPSRTLEGIRETLREFKLYAGVSLMFQEFSDFPLYYKQAGIALKYGIKENHTQWMHYFEEYCFSYMLDCCTKELPPEMLFPPALHKLIEHDKRKSTNYVETLRAYLENDSKPSKAMKVLYVQRSTFLYRLERINEIMDADLENEKIKNHFLLAFQLMDKKRALHSPPC